MTDLNTPRELLASLRAALQQMESALGSTRAGGEEILAQATEVRDGVYTLCTLRGHEGEYTGVDMLYDRANDLQQVLEALETLIADARDDLNTLETAMDEDALEDRS